MKKILNILKALSDVNRLRIICLLYKKSGLCVCEIRQIIGLSQPTISLHLKKLEDADLISHTKDGLWVNYFLSENLDENIKQIVKKLFEELKNDKKILEDLKKAEKISRIEICKKD